MSWIYDDSSAEGLYDLTPLVGPVAVIETERKLPAGPAAFAHAKIVKVTSGRVRVRTRVGERVLQPRDVLILGRGEWAQVDPMPSVRTWTVCIEDAFLRHHLSWALPRETPLKQGVHPTAWDGQAIYLRIDREVLAQVEPLLRQMSLISLHQSAAKVAKLMTLFASVVEVNIANLVSASGSSQAPSRGTARLAAGTNSTVSLAINLMREQIGRPWSTAQLAHQVSISRSQLSRLFQRHTGTGPIHFLNEMRLTTFTRLIEETTMTVEAAAHQVGWDRRVALRRFSLRHGISPTDFRSQPAAAIPGEAPCLLCPPGRSCVRPVPPSDESI